MTEVVSDLYNVGGQDWVMMVDRFSGYVWMDPLKRKCTRNVTDLLTVASGVQMAPYIAIRRGTQFRYVFKEFCSRSGITHELMLPYNNPQANDIAEVAIKNVKNIILKCRSRSAELPSEQHQQ